MFQRIPLVPIGNQPFAPWLQREVAWLLYLRREMESLCVVKGLVMPTIFMMLKNSCHRYVLASASLLWGAIAVHHSQV